MSKILPNNFQQNKPLRAFCTFGIGGNARYFVEVRQVCEMQEALLACCDQGIPYFILGKGSNCLFDDRGYNGVVILNKIDFMEHPFPGTFHVGAGYSFSLLGTQTARQGWSGLEFASGIPGSVGGAVFMNAGANGCDTAAHLQSVTFISQKGEIHLLGKEQLQFGYRISSFQNMQGAIVGATFSLSAISSARQKQMEILAYRKKTQPYGDKSAGCIFRNPACAGAGALIDQCGLKGMQVGDAKVSEKHANFIVNMGNASSRDVLTLIEIVKKQVKRIADMQLESEVRYIPYI